jgi:hypothetical protein
MTATGRATTARLDPRRPESVCSVRESGAAGGVDRHQRRAARHARELPNLYLETSWCRSREVRRLIDNVGVDRVLFG